MNRIVLLPALLLPLATSPVSARAQSGQPLTPIAPGAWLAHDPAGNVIVAAGKDAVVIVGPQSASTQPALRQAIARLTSVPVRFVVVTASPAIEANRDAGWGQASATVIAEEHAAFRMASSDDPTGATRPPALGFSEVQQVHAAGDDIHVVRQAPGATDADVSAHFERAGILYLGSSFVADGYPTVDEGHGGSFTGLIETSAKFMTFSARTRVVPGRGGISTTADLRAYHDMLVGIRDRVRTLRNQGRSLPAILAAHPTAQYDARWGHTPGAADALVTAAYHSLSAPKS